MPFSVDVECECGTVRSVLLRSSYSEPDEEDTKCPSCGSVKFTRLIGKSTYMRSNDPEVRSAMLKKRSEDHSKATFKDNLERVKDYTAKRGVKL